MVMVLSLTIVVLANAAESPDADTAFDQGTALFQQGSFENAALSWIQAARGFEAQGKVQEQVTALIHLAQAFSSVGRYTQAVTTLNVALGLAKHIGDRTRTATVLGRLGQAVFSLGQPKQALQLFNDGLALANTDRNSQLLAALLNDKGMVLVVQKRLPEAFEALAASIRIARGAGEDMLAVTALINLAMTQIEAGHFENARQGLIDARDTIASLQETHDKAYALISIGRHVNDLRQHLPLANEPLLRHAVASLMSASEIAERLGDSRAMSYARGHLGHLYELSNRRDEALHLTRQAVLAAQQVHAPESLYRWEWQTGRLLRAQGKSNEALLAYRRAVSTLQPIRHELTASSIRGQGSFRESVGPLFFELTDLLLQRAGSLTDPQEYNAVLIQARNTVEEFKSAELQDYFRDDCVQATRANITPLESVARSTAVVYPIILPDRLELLVGLPDGLKRFSVPVSAMRLTQEIRAFRHLLEKRTTHQYLRPARQLYDWIIRPLYRELSAHGIRTLVFVPDGPLRTIPMAPLHDGAQFLIQQYALATTPGLTLTDPRPMNRESLTLLSVGLSESVQGFPALPNVKTELRTIQEMYGGHTLMNDQFLVGQMEREMKEEPVTVVHIASHGEFKSDVQQSFLLAFDDKLTMDRLDRMIGLFQFRDTPLDLLTLSACQTAAGDDRAALGLAGVAIKAGARSALATLWFINDVASSMLVGAFYKYLQDPTRSKAVALQHAQLEVMKDPVFQHPSYWSPFLLINNWL